jgi:arylsulfatase A-like enzyme
MSMGTSQNRAPRNDPAVIVLVLALWFGSWTGLGLLAMRLGGRLIRTSAIEIDPQFIWMAPLASSIVLIVAASILIGWALLVLSIGIGVQAGRLLARRLDAVMPVIRATLAASLAIVLLGATVINARAALNRHRALAALRSADEAAPNILLIILDTVRAINLGLYGYDRPTSPFLDALAERSIVFDRAFSSAPWTLSSHGTMFTGHLPFDLTASWTIPLDGRHPVIAGALREEGYVTGAFVANSIFGPPVFGLDRGFIHYSQRPLRLGTVLGASPLIRWLTGLYNRTFDEHYAANRRTADDIAEEFLRWRKRHPDRPYFAFLNLFDAHEPYDPPSPWDTLFGHPELRRITRDRPSATVIRDLTDGYDGGIAYMDDALRRMFEALEVDGGLDNTLVIITSDHGEHLGERDLIDHGNSLYTALLHVPLVISWPGRLPGHLRVDHAVSLRDLPVTIAELAGAPASFPGQSLSRLWTPDAAPDNPDTLYAAVEFAPRQLPWHPIAKGSIRSVMVWPWHYIINGDGSEELYDMERDPTEIGPVATDSAVLARMRTTMATFPERVVAR